MPVKKYGNAVISLKGSMVLAKSILASSEGEVLFYWMHSSSVNPEVASLCPMLNPFIQ